MSNTISTTKDIVDLIKSIKDAWPILLLIPGSVVTSLASLPRWVYVVLALVALLVTACSLYRIRRVLLYKPLRTAALEAYEKLHGGIYAAAAERMHDKPGPERTLEYMGQLLINDGDMRVFGIRPPSRVFQQIDPTIIKRSAVKDDCATLEPNNDRDPPWTNLYLLRSEFRARLKQMKEDDWRKRPKTVHLPKAQVIAKQEQLLRGAADHQSLGQILAVSCLDGTMIQVRNEVVNDIKSARDTAEWEEAVEQLRLKGYVELVNENDTLTLYKLTAKGYEYADELNGGA